MLPFYFILFQDMEIPVYDMRRGSPVKSLCHKFLVNSGVYGASRQHSDDRRFIGIEPVIAGRFA
ncbi:MAG: hypothetical protein A4E65_02761 [Syntrophorhabdus sp. PtaU1.Bin153]|nr:MAG: hypothetical protein A4E65_02761 [Syntrophorhabdus sp. PtaU1.Bin153]